MVRPKKHLGQHFLTDPAIAQRIVSSLEARTDDVVLEVGPGTGVLTQWLLEEDINFFPVEIDDEAVEHLTVRWPELEESLVRGDFLALDFAQFSGEKLHIIGNFPYNISSQIFFKVLENRQRVDSVVCMLQKEVAERICSSHGTKKYGILSVLIQAYFDCSYLFSVKPGSFFPPPKVTSGVIRLKRNAIHKLDCDEQLFFKVVKAVFNQRRKMIRNSIQSILVHLESQHELLSKRPEQLGVQEFVELTNWVASQQPPAPDPFKQQ